MGTAKIGKSYPQVTPKVIKGAFGDLLEWNSLQLHPGKNLKPEVLNMYLEEAETGFIQNIMDLYNDILEQDLTIDSLLQVRKSGVISKGYNILPIDETPEAKEQADWMIYKLESISESKLTGAESSRFLGFDNLLSYLLNGVGFGFSVVKLNWSTGAEYYPASAEKIHQRNFRISDSTGDFNPYQLRLLTKNESSTGIPLPDYRFITYYDCNADYLTRSGLLRKSLFYALFKKYGLKWFTRYAELSSVPFRLATFDPNSPTKEEDVRVLKSAMASMGSAGYGILPNTADMKFIEGARSGSNNPSDQLIKYCDEQLTKLWLGQTATTEQTPGKLGNSKEQEAIQDKLIAQDAKNLASVINRSLIVPMALFNFGEVKCYFDINTQPSEDLKEFAETMKIINDMSIPIPASYIYEKMNIPTPEEGEAVSKSQEKSLFSRDLNLSIKQDRTDRDNSIRNDMRELEDNIVSKSFSIYNKLFSNLTEDNYEEKLNGENKDNFKKAFLSLAESELPKVDKIFEKYYPNIINNANVFKVNWKKTDKAALDFIKWMSYTTSIIESETLPLSIISEIKDGLQNGLVFKDILKTIKSTQGLEKANPYHIKTLWSNNMATAHSVSTLKKMQSGGFPAWEFLNISDSRTTDICVARGGRFYSANNTSEYPPLHDGCRSEASPVDATEIKDGGYKITGTPPNSPSPEKGWSGFAATSYERWASGKTSQLPSRIQADILKKAKELDN